MTQVTQDEMYDLLSAQICRVEFTKTNGEKRVMMCTRDLNEIPTESHPGDINDPQEKKVDEHIGVVRCFDVEANGWRSFRVNSVIDFSIVE